MKLLKYLLVMLTSVVFISACQKELSFDLDGAARGTLKKDAATDECLPSTINGIYREDSALNNTNFIDIQVNLTSTGTYDIKSDTLNGYSFRGTGSLGVNGLNTVRLYGSGTPVTPGVNSFTIMFDSSVCVVNVIVIGVNTTAAVFTFDGAPGTCGGAIVNGTYIAGVALGIDNTVTLTIDVINAGTYTFGTIAVNGIEYSATGYMPNTGLQTITLNGTGTPVTDGTINITATNNTSSCTFSVIVSPATSGPATYTLNSTAGECSGATYTGVYDAGVAVTAANTVLVNVTVTTVGTYTITSGTTNGITFSGSGTFTAAGGPQPVTLTATGTPTTAGIFNYTIVAGTTTCTFSITVNGTILPVNEDYIPETSFSNWSDKLIGGVAADTTFVQVSPNTIVKNGITYKIFEGKLAGVPTDSSYHRKNLGLYYQLFDQDYGFDTPFNVDGLLLDSNMAVNVTWDIFLGTNTFNGLPASGFILGRILEKGATAVIQGNTYNNVIKVSYTYNMDLGSGNAEYAAEEIWYAKGKGVIYYKVNDIPVSFTEVYETTRTQIY